eukprot:1189073-Prorocentrum_minimum.AAC.5
MLLGLGRDQGAKSYSLKHHLAWGAAPTAYYLLPPMAKTVERRQLSVNAKAPLLLPSTLSVP